MGWLHKRQMPQVSLNMPHFVFTMEKKKPNLLKIGIRKEIQWDMKINAAFSPMLQ